LDCTRAAPTIAFITKYSDVPLIGCGDTLDGKRGFLLDWLTCVDECVLPTRLCALRASARWRLHDVVKTEECACYGFAGILDSADGDVAAVGAVS